MNSKKLSDAMSELDTKYVDKALNYKKKSKKPNWGKWGAVAAGLCLVAAAIGVSHILNSVQDDTTTNVIATKMAFEAKVLEVQNGALIVEPIEGTPERELTESIAIDTEDLGECNTVEYVKRAQIGDTIKVCYLKEDSDISNGVIAVYEIISLEENK
jgi:hypothetical protein